MKVVVLYHPNNDEFAGMVQDYAAEFERFKGKKLELKSLETTEGAQLAELYGITQYPAFLIMSDNGSLIRLWEGTPLPLMDELSYYIGETQEPISRLGHTIALNPV